MSLRVESTIYGLVSSDGFLLDGHVTQCVLWLNPFLSEIVCCVVKLNNGCEEVFIKIYMIYFHSINLSLVPQEYQGTDRFWMAETVTLLLPWGDWRVCGVHYWCGFCLSKWILGMYRQACHYAFDWQVSRYKFFFFKESLLVFHRSLFFFRSEKLLIAHEIWKNNVCKKLKYWFIDVGPVVWWSADGLQIARRCEL